MREKIELDWPEDLDGQQKHCAVLQSEIAVASDRKDELLKVVIKAQIKIKPHKFALEHTTTQMNTKCSN